MPAGIEIYNNSGILQITDKFRNLQYLDKIVEVRQAGSYYLFDVQVGAEELVAFRVSPSTVTISPIYRGLTGHLIFRVTPVNITATIELFRFGFVEAPPPQNSGLEIYTEEGKLVFSSGLKYMKVVGHEIGTYNNQSLLSVTNHSADIKAAVLIGSRYAFVFQIVEYIQSQEYWDIVTGWSGQGFTFNTDNVTTKDVDEGTYFSSSTDGGYGANYIQAENRDWNFLVIDVTNY